MRYLWGQGRVVKGVEGGVGGIDVEMAESF